MLVTPGSKKKAAQRAAQAKSGRGAGGKDMEIKNPDVDVVIPISGTMYLEHLRNCLRHLSRQSFPREDMGVIVSCLMHEAVDDAKLFELCKNHQATVVFTKPHQKAFNRGYALNIGARHGSRRMIALLDSDVVLHPDTIKISVNHCRSAVMAIIPVARTDKPPSAPVWNGDMLKNPNGWREFASKFKYERGGFGNAVVQRSVFEKIHGHDERFFGWGGIDTDLYYRMLKSGRVINLEDIGAQRALHQQHPAPPSKKDPEMTKRNRKLLAESKSIVRNPNKWGGVRCL